MKTISRLWSRLPIFLKILLYGVAIIPVMITVILSMQYLADRSCRAVREKEAEGWLALADHFDQWNAAHPDRVGRMPDGEDEEFVAPERRAGYCRRSAETMRRVLNTLHSPGFDEDDQSGRQLWRQILALQDQTHRTCLPPRRHIGR